MAKYGIIEVVATDRKTGATIARKLVDTTECATLKDATANIVIPMYAAFACEIKERMDDAITDGYALQIAHEDIRIACKYLARVTAVGVSSSDNDMVIGAAKSAAAKRRKARKAAKAAKAKRNASAKTKALAAGINTSVRVTNAANVA